jgi:inorganic triphosphatase YgiF
VGEPVEPTRSLEVEVAFDVDPDAALPDLAALPGVSMVTAGERRSLDARYVDTADAALVRAGIALRRRTGGPDAGWHIKGPKVDGARTELHWELGESVGDIPARAVAQVATMTGSAVPAEALLPLARIRNERVANRLHDAGGAMVAEFADDRVIATDERTGIERRWREWELELGPAAPADPSALFAAAAHAVHEVGGRPTASASKLARALGA